MKGCDDTRASIAFYLDDELCDADRSRFEAHVAACAECRDALDAERNLLGEVRRSAPLYTAPDSLRSEVERVLRDAPVPLVAPPGLRRRVESSLGAADRRRRAVAAAAAVVLAVMAIWAVATHEAPAPSSEFARMAVDVHMRYLRGGLPLEIETSSAAAVSAWFVDKVPFRLELPNYQEISGQDRLYTLDGARLVGFEDDYAAYVAYTMGARRISLVVTSSEVARPSGGEEVVSKGLTFHCDAVNGLKVISWSDRGLTYALVSDLEERGQASCIVCHTGTQDRDFIESLKP